MLRWLNCYWLLLVIFVTLIPFLRAESKERLNQRMLDNTKRNWVDRGRCVEGFVRYIREKRRKKQPTTITITTTEKYVITNIVWARTRERWNCKRERKIMKLKRKSAIVSVLWSCIQIKTVYFDWLSPTHQTHNFVPFKFSSPFLKSNSIYFIFEIQCVRFFFWPSFFHYFYRTKGTEKKRQTHFIKSNGITSKAHISHRQKRITTANLIKSKY